MPRRVQGSLCPWWSLGTTQGSVALSGSSSPQAGSGHRLVGRGWARPWGGRRWLWEGGRGGSEVVAALPLAGQSVEGAQRRLVALVQPPHAVALVMDVMGDVLQVLQVGPAPGRKNIKSPFPPPLSPPWGVGTTPPIPCPSPATLSPDQQVPQEGEFAVRRVLHCKARQSGQWGGQEGRVGGGCWGGTSRLAPGTTGAPARLHTAPPGQGCTHGCCSTPTPPVGCPPGTWGGLGGAMGLRSPSMTPHLVLRPSTRLPFTWCSWSAPTTAKGIFSCQRRGARSPRGAAPPTPPHPQGRQHPPIPASLRSPESCHSAPCHQGPGQSPPEGTR